MAEQEPKKRRILDRDFDKVEAWIKEEFEARKKNPFRKKQERKWRVVDRQIEMEPMKRVAPDGREIKGDWQSALELGELSKSSEIITADVMRIEFAKDQWMEAHTQIEGQMDEQSGRYVAPEGAQEQADGLMRALVVQQQKDFGFKGRFKLSIKEALHHGSFVAHIRWEQRMMVQGAKIKTVGAPVWQPFSMWNAYPDASPSVIGTDLFYTGSMILVEYMPLHKLKRMNGEGWIPSRIKLVKKEEHKDKDNDTQDVQLIRYFGDIVIERGDGDIYLPNMEVTLANNKLVFAKPNDLPYLPIIFAGYERQDIRNPYYTSPIIKQSPTQTITTVLANEFVDSIRLRTKPPVEYDGNDPDYVANGGPDLSPGSKNPTKSMGKGFKSLEIGDPNVALEGMQFGIRQLQEGLGVSSLRQGSMTSDRQTATEAKIMEQGSEVRTIDFIADLEQQALRSFLYMQHDLNKKHLKEYLAYSDELNTPDMYRFTNDDVQKDVHWDVVGAKGILGEQQRQQQTFQVTAFASQNPMFASLLKAQRILIDMYKEAGKKNPEEWVTTQGPQIPPQVQAMIQQLQQQLQEAQSGLQAKMAQIEADKQKSAAELQLDRQKAKADYQLAVQNSQRDFALKAAEMRAELALEMVRAKSEHQATQAGSFVDMHKAAGEFVSMLEKASMDHSQRIAKAADTVVKGAESVAQAAQKIAARPKKAKIKKTPDGYQVEEA